MATLKELIDLHCDGVEGYSEIAAILNAPTVVPNPRAGEVDTYTVIAPITMDAIIEVVPTGEAAAISKGTQSYCKYARGYQRKQYELALSKPSWCCC